MGHLSFSATAQTPTPDPCPLEWSHTFDFTEDDHDWVPWITNTGGPASWTTAGWQGSRNIFGSLDGYHLRIAYRFPTLVTITGIEFHGTFEVADMVRSPFSNGWYIIEGSASNTTSVPALTIVQVQKTLNGTGTYTVDGNPLTNSGGSPISMNLYWLGIYVTTEEGFSPQDSFNNLVDSITVFGTGINPFDEGCNPNASFTADPTTGTAPATVQFTDTSTGIITNWFWDFDDETTSTEENPVHLFEDAGNYRVCLTVTGPGGSDEACQNYFVSGVGAPSSLLYKPLDDADILEQFGIYDVATAEDFNLAPSGARDAQPEDYLVVATANTANLNVYAVADGTVTSISPVLPGDCFGIYNYLGTGRCMLQIIRDEEPFPVGVLDVYAFMISTESLYRVQVSFDNDRYIEYIVRDAPLYITEGQEISAGCIIGKTAGFQPVGPLGSDYTEVQVGEVNLGFNTGSSQGGAAFVSLFETTTGERTPLVNQLVVSVIPSNACNADPEFASCLGDPQFRHRNDWTSTGIVFWSDGVTLKPNASISMVMNLSGLVAYSFTVQIERIGLGTGEVTLRVGQTVEDFPLNVQLDDYTLGPATHVADAQGFYTIAIMNTGNTDFKVLSNCLTDGTPSQKPAICYFANYSFDQGDDEWTTTGGVGLGFQTGELFMPHMSTIAQNALLYPAGSSAYQYRVTVRATIFGASSPEADTTSTVSFQWQYTDTEAWSDFLSPNSTDSYPFAGFFGNRVNNITFFPNNEVLFEASVNVEEVSNALFKIRVDIDDSGQMDFSGGVLIREVCINDPFDNWPIGGGSGLPFRELCTIVSPPDDQQIGSWIFYHWSNLDRFFQCDLMKLLNSMWQLMLELFEFIQWQMLYWQTYVINLNHWLGHGLFPWLAGHFDNIALGRSTTIIQESGGCDNFFCLLEALINQVLNPIIGLIQSVIDTLLNILTQAASVLFSLIIAFISLIFSMFNTVLNFFNTLISMVGYLVTGVANAEPVPLPGLPTCQLDPQQNGLCQALWGLENTVFADEGQIYIPLIVSIAVILLLKWAINEFREKITQVTDKL